MDDVLFSSQKHTYETPDILFNKLNKVFKFKRDLAANKYNTKCKIYFSDNALNKNWDCKGWQWLNPPYGRALYNWIEKSYKESERGNKICLLIPARTDTKYQQDLIFEYASMVCFIKGRLKFSSEKNCAPFPSQLILFSNNIIGKQKYDLLSKFGFTIDLKYYKNTMIIRKQNI